MISLVLDFLFKGEILEYEVIFLDLEEFRKKFGILIVLFL